MFLTRVILLVGLGGAAHIASAQFQIDMEGQEFLALRHKLEVYFDSLKNAGNTEAFGEGGPYAEFKKWSEFWSLRLDGSTDFENYLSRYADCVQDFQAKAGGSNSGDWHEVGPSTMPGGLTQIGSGQTGIGPIYFVRFYDPDPDHMLCGSFNGGVYYRDDPDGVWTNGGGDLWPQRCGTKDAVFKTDDPAAWFAVTSDVFGLRGGVMRTADAGLTWEQIGDQYDFTQGGFWSSAVKLLTDPSDPDVLWLATSHALYRTNNANEADPALVTWTEISIAVPPTISNHPVYGAYGFVDDRFINDLEMHPSDPSTLYASVRFDGLYTDSNNNQYWVRYWLVMMTSDGGATWVEVPNQPAFPFVPGSGTTGDQNGAGLVLEVTNADEDYLYVLRLTVSGSGEDVYKIAGIGSAWVALNGSLDVDYGWHDMLCISQADPDEVHVGQETDFKSYINGVWNFAANALQFHDDVEDLNAHPNNDGELWMAHHGGVSRSLDHGVTWEWKGDGLGVAEVYRLANSYSEPGYTLMGLYHDANVLSDGNYTEPWSPGWTQLGGNDGQVPMIDPLKGQYMYWSSGNGGNDWRKSTDHGVTNSLMSPDNGANIWDKESKLDHEQPERLFVSSYVNGSGVSSSMEIRRSEDRGASWESVTDFSTQLDPFPRTKTPFIWRIYPAWADPNWLYAHVVITNDPMPQLHMVFRTNQARGNAAVVRASWVEVPVPRETMWLSDMDHDPEDPNIVYYAYSSSAGMVNTVTGAEMVYRVNYNPPVPVFEDLTGTGPGALPNTGIGPEAMVLERGSDGGIYIATDAGVYFTNNKLMGDGTWWVPLGTNLPHTQCRGLEINYKVNKLRAGMFGRGLWERSLYCPPDADATLTGLHTANVFHEVQDEVLSDAQVPIGLEVAYRAGEQVHLTPGFHAASGAHFHALIHPCEEPGNSFKALSAGASPDLIDEGRLPAPSGRVFPNPSEGVYRVTNVAWQPQIAAWLIDVAGVKHRTVVSKCDGGVEVRTDARLASGIYQLELQAPDGTRLLLERVVNISRP